MAIGLGVLVLVFGTSAVALAVASAAPLRGQSSQNQPLVLTLDRRSHELRVRLPYILRCRVVSNEGPPFFKTPLLRVFGRGRLLGVSRSGAVAGTFRFREHRHPNEGYGLVDRRSLKVVRFSGSVTGAHPAGEFRVTVTAREIRTDSEVAFPLRHRIRCDSGITRWRVPHIRFAGPWRPTGAMLVPRFGGVLTTLRDGRILLAGGVHRERSRTQGLHPERVVGAVEIHGPANNRWRRAGTLRTPRHSAGSVRLADGRVLVAGGSAQAGVGSRLSAAEIYDPRRRRWTRAAPMRVPRLNPTLTLLPSGQVLAVSGFAPGAARAAELYDPISDAWSFAADTPAGQSTAHTSSGWALASLLPTGRVLLAGGFDEPPSTWTVYDPGSNSWTPRESIPGVYRVQAGTRLADGRVFVLGGSLADDAPIAAAYGPSGWTPVAKPTFDRGAIFDAGMALLPSGRVLLASRAQGLVAIYDPTLDQWTPGPARLFEYPSYFSPNPLRLAIAPRGALLVDQGLNRFSSAERFYEP